MSNSRDKIGKSIDGILGNLTIRGRDDKAHEEIVQLKKKLAAYDEEMGAYDELKKERQDLALEILRLRKEQNEQIQKTNYHIETLRNEQIMLENIIREKQQEADSLERELEHLVHLKATVTQELDQLKKKSDELSGETAIPQAAHCSTGSFQGMPLAEKDREAYCPSPVILRYCDQAEGKRKLTIHLREIEYQAILKASHHLQSSKGQLMDTITKALRFYISSNYYQDAEREVYNKAMRSVQIFLE